MKKFFSGTAILLLLSAGNHLNAQTRTVASVENENKLRAIASIPPQSSIRLRHINIVNVKTGVIISNQIVTIVANRIASIRQDNDKQISEAGQAVDGTDKYLIPGLWDMHSHNNGDINYIRTFIIPIMLANGVTGFRDMWGMKEEIAIRDSVDQGLFVAPRMIVGTPLINGPSTFFDGSISIKTVKQVPRIVDSLQNIGYNFLKVYSFLRHDIFVALAAYSKQKHFLIAGHIPIGVTAEEASNAGMQSIEHLFGLRKSFSNSAKKLCNQWENEVSDTSGFASQFNILSKTESLSLPFDTVLANKVTATLVANHMAVVPTITAIMGASLNVDTLKQLIRLTYVQPPEEKMWYDGRRAINFEKGFGENSMQLLNFIHKQGVIILAGTDNENPFVLQGVSIHDELKYYVQAGLSPLEALQTATINPAIFLHKEKDLGTVSKGKLADLVILEKNPLTDIRNTREINAVIMNGHLINKIEIEESLKKLRGTSSKE